jgi:hypothetical protein
MTEETRHVEPVIVMNHHERARIPGIPAPETAVHGKSMPRLERPDAADKRHSVHKWVAIPIDSPVRDFKLDRSLDALSTMTNYATERALDDRSLRIRSAEIETGPSFRVQAIMKRSDTDFEVNNSAIACGVGGTGNDFARFADSPRLCQNPCSAPELIHRPVLLKKEKGRKASGRGISTIVRMRCRVNPMWRCVFPQPTVGIRRRRAGLLISSSAYTIRPSPRIGSGRRRCWSGG